MKLFFTIWYGKTVVGQIVAPAETTEQQARQKMIEDLWKVPGVLKVDGCTPGETESMLKWGTLKTYPLPQCKTPACQTCH